MNRRQFIASAAASLVLPLVSTSTAPAATKLQVDMDEPISRAFARLGDGDIVSFRTLTSSMALGGAGSAEAAAKSLAALDRLIDPVRDLISACCPGSYSHGNVFEAEDFKTTPMVALRINRSGRCLTHYDWFKRENRRQIIEQSSLHLIFFVCLVDDKRRPIAIVDKNRYGNSHWMASLPTVTEVPA